MCAFQQLIYVQDAAPYPTLRDTGPSASAAQQINVEDGLVPTQRLSQVIAPFVLSLAETNLMPDPRTVVRSHIPFLLDMARLATPYFLKTPSTRVEVSTFF